MNFTAINMAIEVPIKIAMPKNSKIKSSKSSAKAKAINVIAGGKFVPGGSGRAKKQALTSTNKKIINRIKKLSNIISPRDLNRNSILREYLSPNSNTFENK